MFFVRRFPDPSSSLKARSAFCGPPHTKTRRISCPPTESLMNHGSEQKDAVRLSFDVPGVKKDNVSIEEHDGVLQVSAKRKSDDGETVVGHLEKKYTIDERMVDVPNIHAKLSDGVLTIVLPKNKDAKRDPTPITITPGYPPAEDEEEQEDATMKTTTENAEDDATTKDEKDKDKKPNFRFSTDIPGVKLEDIEIKLIDVYGTDASHLNIRASRQKGRFVTEIHRQCTIPVSHFDVNKIQVFLADGVLTVIVPPRTQNNNDASSASKGPRKIAINTAPSLLTTNDDGKDTTMDTTVTDESPKEAKDAVIVETVKEA